MCENEQEKGWVGNPGPHSQEQEGAAPCRIDVPAPLAAFPHLQDANVLN